MNRSGRVGPLPPLQLSPRRQSRMLTLEETTNASPGASSVFWAESAPQSPLRDTITPSHVNLIKSPTTATRHSRLGLFNSSHTTIVTQLSYRDDQSEHASLDLADASSPHVSKRGGTYLQGLLQYVVPHQGRLDPEFSPFGHMYTLYVPDSADQLYFDAGAYNGRVLINGEPPQQPVTVAHATTAQVVVLEVFSQPPTTVRTAPDLVTPDADLGGPTTETEGTEPDALMQVRVSYSLHIVRVPANDSRLAPPIKSRAQFLEEAVQQPPNDEAMMVVRARTSEFPDDLTLVPGTLLDAEVVTEDWAFGTTRSVRPESGWFPLACVEPMTQHAPRLQASCRLGLAWENWPTQLPSMPARGQQRRESHPSQREHANPDMPDRDGMSDDDDYSDSGWLGSIYCGGGVPYMTVLLCVTNLALWLASLGSDEGTATLQENPLIGASMKTLRDYGACDPHSLREGQLQLLVSPVLVSRGVIALIHDIICLALMGVPFEHAHGAWAMVVLAVCATSCGTAVAAVATAPWITTGPAALVAGLMATNVGVVVADEVQGARRRLVLWTCSMVLVTSVILALFPGASWWYLLGGFFGGAAAGLYFHCRSEDTLSAKLAVVDPSRRAFQTRRARYALLFLLVTFVVTLESRRKKQAVLPCPCHRLTCIDLATRPPTLN
ncbi:uncharacterized protein MONBRDRAFT_11381 [Monosiga brevicollis MX1]|uniref:rhomboid protease n=1 Tax=Monosiga brevicollis TaxID=81824 RepID=A9V932_MONBE|nr:uncharacterized protein MONBRDRAFT_11381 [Monosiga brevicollis MX1]EDQ85983.1 predicted protein [Monosiga brevicollis MX1]|eukprot:XP_001749177.1 hypothetical protein [Monosiga brevicollis MX1]